jgi:hypothetical protein
MDVAALRHALAALDVCGEQVALDQRDALKVICEDACSKQASDAASDDDRVSRANAYCRAGLLSWHTGVSFSD